MNIHWKMSMLWTTCLFLAANAGICAAQEEDPPLVPVLGDAASDASALKPPRLDASSTLAPRAQDAAAFGTDEPIGPYTPILDSAKSISVTYIVERPVEQEVKHGSSVAKITRYVREVKSVQIALDADLNEFDLPPDGKRAAVLALTAARHEGLLRDLKEAKSDEEKKKAVDALKTNYTEHYAIETWWREQRLAELEQRLTEMRQQVQQRQDAQEKYVDAAMTIAELWAEGIAIAPPKPGSQPEHGNSAGPVYPTPLPTAGSTTIPVPSVREATSDAPRMQPPATLPGPSSFSTRSVRQ